MNVLNISMDDYANFAHDNANALRSVGVNVVDVKTHPHIYSYDSQSHVVPRQNIPILAQSADIIQIFHSDEILLNLVKNLNKKIIVYHTGTRYRLNPHHFNMVFNPHVERSIIALGEFAGLGSKNETYVVGAVNDLWPINLCNDFVKIAHYPSNAKIKGTEKILEMMSKIDTSHNFNFSTSSEAVPYKEQMDRMLQCDIYIELFKPTQAGKKYGSFGITALEAASMGKVVVTQNLSEAVYAKNYGHCPFILCKSEQEFINKMNALLKSSTDIIASLQHQTYEWFQKNHSYTSTGYKLKQILESCL